MIPEIKLNPALDRLALKKEFAAHRRIHIPKILTPDSAERIHRCLTQDVQWHFVFNEGDKTHTLYPEQLKAITPAQMQKIKAAVLGQAREGFQFMYYDYNIYDYYLNGKNMDHFLHRVHEFVNSESYLGFIREITGVESIKFADSQATAYGPGNFLTLHHDEVPGKNRKFAYVFNFTKKWQMDWGGILQFRDQNGNVDGGFIPTFNALNMFEVPQDHSVSYVSPFCPETRFSITGWVRQTDDSNLVKPKG